MPVYDAAFFLTRFRQLDTDELIERALTRELTDEAKQAIREILAERGVQGHALELRVDEVAKSRYRRSGVTNQCDLCGKNSLGPLRDGAQKFCSRECLRQARLLEISTGMAPDLIREHAWSIRMSACPMCKRQGSIVEMQPCYLVASLIYICRRETTHDLCCQRCSRRNSLKAVLYCMVLGWWSALGLFVTPLFVVRNMRHAWRPRLPKDPSPQLLYRARLELAESLRHVAAPPRNSQVSAATGS